MTSDSGATEPGLCAGSATAPNLVYPAQGGTVASDPFRSSADSITTMFGFDL